MSEGPDNEIRFPAPQKRVSPSSVAVFYRTVVAFIEREFRTRYGNYLLGYAWSIVEPLALIALLVIGRSIFLGRGPVYGETGIVFFGVGVFIYFTFMASVSGARGSFRKGRSLFVFPQIRPFSVAISGSIVEWLLLVAVFVLFWAIAKWIEYPFYIYDPLKLIFVMMLTFLIGFTLGLLFEVFGIVFPDLEKVFSMIMRPMLFISGMFFTIDMLPSALEKWLIWNPVLHLTDLGRDATMVGYDSPASFGFVVLGILVISALGLAGYRRYFHYFL